MDMMNRCSRFLFAFLLAVGISASMTLAHAQPLQITIEAGDSSGTIKVNLINTGAEPLSILRWETPFEKTLSSDVFQIERPTKIWPLVETAKYVGREVKRTAPESSHFVLLQPGATISTQVVLNEYYDLEHADYYSVKFNGDFHYSNSAVPSDFDSASSKLKAVSELALTEIQSAGMMIELSPKQSDAFNLSARILPPIYSSCTVDQQTAIGAASLVAEQLVDTAVADLSGLADDEKASSPRYNTWFGSFSDTRFNRVVSQYQNIAQALEQETIRYDCGCDESGVYAYVYRSRPYDIFLCPGFDAANIDGTDSRAGTIIHELSHFTILGGTDDHAYGQRAAQALASSDPDRATGNADNMEYFAENTPAISIRSDGEPTEPVQYVQLELDTLISGELADGESLTYEVTDATNVSLNSLSGDADLTIYSDEALSTTICSSNNTSAVDVCEIFQSGRIFIQVIGYTAATFTLEAMGGVITEEPEIVATVLALDSPAVGSLLTGERATYEVEGATVVELDSLSGDADLYLFNSLDFSESTLICSSVLIPSASTLDRCIIPADGGPIYAVVIGYTATDFSLVARFVAETTTETSVSDQGQLNPDQAEQRTISLGEFHNYTVTGVQSVQLTSLSGDADLQVRLVSDSNPPETICTSINFSADSVLDECATIASAEYQVVVFGFTDANYSLLGVSGASTGEPDPASGYVFARTDTSEFRWVIGSNNIWISGECAVSLGGATQTGTWSELNAVAPGFDQAANPCTVAMVDGYVFSRTDTSEYRWVVGSDNIWISSECAASLGGATQSGRWSELNAIAPGFDQAANPCNGTVDEETPPGAAEGFVFSRTDSSEFRWVLGSNNIWINSECASSLGGATQTGNWSELNAIAPGFDQAENPCDGSSVGEGGVTLPASGYVFARDDKDEFRWVVGSNNIWISESCAISLGGASLTGDWSDLNDIAPMFDQAENPCPY